MKKYLSLLIILTIIFGLVNGFALTVSADEDYQWVLVETHYFPIPPENNEGGGLWSCKSSLGNNTAELESIINDPYDNKNYSNLHAMYRWSDLPQVIQPNGRLVVKVEQEAINRIFGNRTDILYPYMKMDAPDLEMGYGTASSEDAKIILPNGTEERYAKFGYGGHELLQGNCTFDMVIGDFGKGFSENQRKGVYVGFYGVKKLMGVRYVYEWQKKGYGISVPAVTIPDTTSQFPQETIINIVSTQSSQPTQLPQQPAPSTPNQVLEGWSHTADVMLDYSGYFKVQYYDYSGRHETRELTFASSRGTPIIQRAERGNYNENNLGTGWFSGNQNTMPNGMNKASKIWGYFKAPETGSYKFGSFSDDGAYGYIVANGTKAEFVDDWRIAGPNYRSNNESFNLKKDGYYPIYLEWFEGMPTETASIFSYKLNDSDWKDVGMEMYPSVSNTPGEIAAEYFEPPKTPQEVQNPVTPPAASASTDTGAEAFESGARLMWPSVQNILGYRLYRSKNQRQLGISVTDFYITSTSYADVNVEPNTTYYYSVKPVLAEANPYQGIEEQLGDVIATFTITTGNEIYKPGFFKHFIMLKLDSPYMSIDGVEEEVDPGRGTAPIVLAGRTMVPIRAVVEAMGGTVGWDGATSLITLEARGNKVEMWLGKTDIKVNGTMKEMDIAPVAKDGRTYVPVRFAAENLNCKVDWINSTKEAIIVYEE